MFRYVGFVWNDADQTAHEAAQLLTDLLQSGSPEWRVGVRQDGLAVFHAGARAGSNDAYLLQEASGIVLGKLFSRCSAGKSVSAPLSIGACETASIFASGGRHLVDRYWGRYVAFFRDVASDTTWVLRDPTATLPCHWMRFKGVTVYFSSMEDGVRLGLGDFAVSWKYLAAALCHTRLQLSSTALDGVSQLLGGECLELCRGRSKRTFYWDPLRIADSEVFEDPAAAVEALRACTRECIHAWASCYSGILHTLSGGLDSSIVLACLQDAPSQPRLACINHHSVGSDTDERAYAQLAARRVGCELIERERNPALSFEPLLHMQRSSAPPVTFLYYLENNRIESQVATEIEAAAVFSGNTGDQVFYQSSAAFAASDYLGRHGLRPALFNVALDSARMDRVSVWNVLREALSHRLFGRPWSPQSDLGKMRALLTRDVIHAVGQDQSFIHPLFRQTGRAANGKVYHAYSLLFAPDFCSPTGQANDPELIAPLYSQPLLEIVLRIPTYLLTRNGWDRAIARRAFQHDVPREIITRQTKGGMEEHAKAIFVRNIALVRELLLDGFLIRERILDRKQLTEVLSGKPTSIGTGTVELYDYFAAEAWIRRWRSAHLLRAAA